MKRTAAVVAALVCLAGPVWASTLAKKYDVVVLPPVELAGVTLPDLVAWDLSNEGHITGQASRLPNLTAGFLYTSDGRMLGIDPPGDFISVGLLVNDLGQVYGESTSPQLKDAFLFSEAEGARSLRDGLPKGSGQLFVHGLNNRGVVIAGAGKSDEPLVYDPDSGWRLARELHPELQRIEGELAIPAFNDQGDFLFQIGLGSVQGSRFQRIEQLILTRDGELHRFGAEGNLILTGYFAARGAVQLVGSMTESDLPLRAYHWNLRRGVAAVTPDGAIEALAEWSPIENVVAGEARFNAHADGSSAQDALFVRTLDGRGPSYTVRAGRFNRLIRKSGLEEFDHLFAIEFNERGEFAGVVTASPGERQIPFVVRGKRRPIALQSIVDAAGVDLRVEELIDLNRAGQIVVTGTTSRGRYTAALLTPRR